jgi:hypothetical protein
VNPVAGSRDGSVTLWGVHATPHTVYAGVTALVLVAVWLLVVPQLARRTWRRRLGICLAVAAAAAAIGLGWHNHAHHARVARAAAAGHEPVAQLLVTAWGGITLAATGVLFAVSTWWVRQRRRGRFRRRRRGGGDAPFPVLPPPGRAGSGGDGPPMFMPGWRR